MDNVVKLEPLALLSPQEIKKDQDSIRRNLSKLDAQIHANAVQCMLHCEQHRDTSLMRRLLVDIIDAKSGYRRQGLIVWMREFSPMTLNGDTVTMGGKVDGKEKPFNVEKARQTPFWTLKAAQEFTLRAVFQDGPMNKVNAAIREFKSALENTENGKPIDPKKPYYDGAHPDKVLDFFEQVEKLKGVVPDDHTREVRQAQAVIAREEQAAAKRA